MRRHDGLAALVLFFFCVTEARAQEEDLARPRFLDQQGVHAFADGHVRDAMALFWASYRAGGPPTELWNVARCQLKLEDSDGARRTLESYLEHKNLADEDRAEGKRLLDEIERRSSMFVVASTPTGAVVSVDGRSIGVTPLTSSLPPGSHEIKIARADGGTTTRQVDARDGRPIIISIELGRGESLQKPRADNPERRFSAELGFLGLVSVLGGGAVVEGNPAPELSLGYAVFTFRRARIGFGVRVRASFDSWTTSPAVSNMTFGCSPPNDYGGAELDVTPTVFGAVRIASRVTLGARAGVGAAIYISDVPIGGDLFAPACAYGGSLMPDAYAAVDVSLRLTDALHLVLFPATFDIHPSWNGSRGDATIDASGAWIRLGLGFALAVNL